MATILLISPEPWNAHSVSKHHYAAELASRGHTVLFLDPPDSDLQEIEILSQQPSHPGVYVVRGPRVAPGLRFMPSPVRRSLERRWLLRLERRLGEKIDVVWLFENSRFYDLNFAGGCLRIYHQVDLNQVFNPATAARTADITFCTTDFIQEQLKPFTANVHLIHHGLHKARDPLPLTPEQRRRFHNRGPHLLYAGNLAMGYLDTALLAQVAHYHNDATLHLVGGAPPDAPLRKALADQTQVVWWGHQPSEALPGILQQADILLVTYQEHHWQDQASPHKFMEYLASGKVIVSTYTHQYRNHRHLLAMADLGEDYLSLLQEVRQNLYVWNASERQQERLEFALQYTYSRQLARIDSYLKSAGLSPVFSD